MAGGRQREFDRQEALDAAMHVFWKKGFVGASLTDLTAAMGINKPSMYATFGNKEELFIESSHRYVEEYVKPHIGYLYEDKPLKQRLKNYLLSVIEGQCNGNVAKGCFVSTCVSESAGDVFPEKAAKRVNELRDLSEQLLTEFFQEEVIRKNLAKQTDCSALACFIMTVLHGTAAMARAGKSITELESIVDTTVSTIDT